MYSHPILVNIAAVTLTIPTFTKHLAETAKAQIVELKADVAHAVTVKKALIEDI